MVLEAIEEVAVVTVFGDNVRALIGDFINGPGGVCASTSDLGRREVGDEVNRDLRDFHQLGEAP